MRKRKKGVEYTGVSIIYFCHDGQGKFVMHKRGSACRDENGCWDIGGGGLEFGEKVFDCLAKEIKEEYGADIKEFEHLGYRDVHRAHKGRPTHWVALDFKVLVSPKQVKNNEPHKFDDVQWFTMDDMPEKLHSDLPNFFKNYKNKL